jgi:phosphodiesterase/alkaline phosphatase D-like protein
MARLIVGHTTHSSCRIWARAHPRYPVAFVRLTGPGVDREQSRALEERHFFTGVFEFRQLEPGTEYTCSATFGETVRTPPEDRVEFGHTTGRLRTFPAPGGDEPLRFLLGSCNLHSLGLIQRPGPAYRQLGKVAADESASFMLHCGDQIYYDVPDASKPPSVDEYRRKYLDAWEDSLRTRKFLTELPHYMILDDHEMVNNFANDMDSSRYQAPPELIRDTSLRVYREFVHIRNPQVFGDQGLYYHFAHGRYVFFVLDTRTERYARPDSGRQGIVSPTQMGHFKKWLLKHRDEVKFVVTSVPFVGETVTNDDKWSGLPYRPQREEVMAFLLRHRIGGLVFLTGDMHCSYHGRLVLDDGDRNLTVDELMASPINQIGKRTIDDFASGVPRTSQDGTFTYTSQLDPSEFFDGHSNAMLVSVEGRTVRWEVFRTKKDSRNELSGSFPV